MEEQALLERRQRIDLLNRAVCQQIAGDFRLPLSRCIRPPTAANQRLGAAQVGNRQLLHNSSLVNGLAVDPINFEASLAHRGIDLQQVVAPIAPTALLTGVRLDPFPALRLL